MSRDAGGPAPVSLAGTRRACWKVGAVAELFAELPDDDRGQRVGLIARRVVMTLLVAIALVALSGAFGQRATSSTDMGSAATLRLEAPATVRGGIFFQARIDVDAVRTVGEP